MSWDPLVYTTDALVGPVCLSYAFPPLKILPRLLRRSEAEGISHSSGPGWPCLSWFADVPWHLLLREDLLFQRADFSILLQSLVLKAWLL